MRHICPKDGEPTICLVCKPDRTHHHRREEWVPAGRRPPKCETHDLPLVPAK